MSKKEKNIQIQENEKMLNGKQVYELVTQDGEVVGTVTEEESRFKAVNHNGEQMTLASRDEAYSWILRAYHLHH